MLPGVLEMTSGGAGQTVPGVPGSSGVVGVPGITVGAVPGIRMAGVHASVKKRKSDLALIALGYRSLSLSASGKSLWMDTLSHSRPLDL